MRNDPPFVQKYFFPSPDETCENMMKSMPVGSFCFFAGWKARTSRVYGHTATGGTISVPITDEWVRGQVGNDAYWAKMMLREEDDTMLGIAWTPEAGQSSSTQIPTNDAARMGSLDRFVGYLQSQDIMVDRTMGVEYVNPYADLDQETLTNAWESVMAQLSFSSKKGTTSHRKRRSKKHSRGEKEKEK